MHLFSGDSVIFFIASLFHYERLLDTPENSVEVSTSASYSFAVTANRTLSANFNDDDAREPPAPPVPSYGGDSSGNYVGSNKADASSNLKPSVTNIPFTKAEATKLFSAAFLGGNR